MKVNNKKRFIVFSICVIIIVVITIVLVIKPFKNNNQIKNEENKNNETDVATNEINYSKAENIEYINGEKVNVSERMYHERRIDDLIFNILSIKTEKKECKVSIKVQNIGSEEFTGKNATLTFYKNDTDIYGKLDTYIGKIPVGKSTTVEITTTLDITNALEYNMEFAK